MDSAGGWWSQATVAACLAAFLYEGYTYNTVFLSRILPALGQEDQVTPYLIGFDTLWGLTLWSYLRVSWTNPGAVPQAWHDFSNKAGLALPIAPGMKEWQPGKATMCRFCVRPRPERAHHCAICGVCIMRLDHHCPWLNNCVGFGNHKFFLQTCIYALLGCVVGFVTAAPTLVVVAQQLKLEVHGLQPTEALSLSDEVAFLAFGALSVFISMFLTPLLYFQLRLALTNKTTIEDNYVNMSNPFDQGGPFRNLTQIFGKFGPDWLLPIAPWRPTVDGIAFPQSFDRSGPLAALNSGYSDNEDYSRDRSPQSKWAPLTGIYSGKTGEEFWRIHYQVEDHKEDMQKPTTLDLMLGCMQLDCEGNQKGSYV